MSDTYHRVQVTLSMTMFLVIVCNRSLTEDVCRTMDHETGAKGRAAPRLIEVRERAEV